jgi:hypothetical protein
MLKEKFQEYYRGCLVECLTTTKAKKDIVGARYEEHRDGVIKSSRHLDIATKEEVKKFKEMYDGNFDADKYIVHEKTRQLLAVEEDKGHYVDKCFLKRAMENALETFATSIEKGFEVPYFILNSPTSYSKYEEVFQRKLKLIHPEYVECFKAKFVYFPLCLHGRVSRTKYLNPGIENPFTLDDNLCYNHDSFYNNLGEV